MTRQARHIITAVMLLLLSATISLAASMNIVSSGGSKFVIQGDGMDGVAGFDLVLSYSGTLSSPSVAQGTVISGALMAVNTNIANTIKIGVVSTKNFSASGQIATITFATGSGSVKIASLNMISASGASVGGSTTSGEASNISQQPGIPFSTPTTTTPPPAPSTSTALGTVTMPTDSQPQHETKTEEPAPVQPPPAASSTDTTPPSAPEQTAALRPEESKKPESIKSVAYGSVIERFRVYQGEKNPAILAALFKKEVAPSIRQEPPVAISDGKTSVRIIAKLPASDEKSPNFALNGAKLVSLKKDDETGSWIIDAMPQENVLYAGVTILYGSEIIEFPLTVAPAVKGSNVSEASFVAFLKSSGKAGDLNNDGKHDYIDDYIYTANYLAQINKGKK